MDGSARLARLFFWAVRHRQNGEGSDREESFMGDAAGPLGTMITYDAFEGEQLALSLGCQDVGCGHRRTPFDRPVQRCCSP